MIVIKTIRVVEDLTGKRWEMDVEGFVHPGLSHTHVVPEAALESKRLQYDLPDDVTDEEVLEIILDEVWARYPDLTGKRPRTDRRVALPERTRPPKTRKGGERKR